MPVKGSFVALSAHLLGPRRRSWFAMLLTMLTAALIGCVSSASEGAGREFVVPPETTSTLPRPVVPSGALDPDVEQAVDLLVERIQYASTQAIVDRLVASEDPRVAWYLVDVLRFVRDRESADPLIEGIGALTGVTADPSTPWSSAVDQLLVWDIPAPPGYFERKRAVFTIADDRWSPLFDDQAPIDWRLVGWGGVYIDDRPLGDLGPCPLGCIPALDDPPVTDAAGGEWLPDTAFVFGVEINGEARAYPKHIMEVHEMVNDTLGGRRIGVPYCTLCGSAQAYLLDTVPTPDRGTSGGQPLVLRTSGLLLRSNKMMYDLVTGSLIDTFLGTATSGPLLEQGVELEQVSVVTATWGEWTRSHPETTIVAQDGGRSRAYPLDPLRGRDDDGPIFPVGVVDPRLAVQEPVLGVLTSDGQPVAFVVAEARAAVHDGERVTFDGVEVVLVGDGLRAVRRDREGGGMVDAAGHQAFWFAWSQFHPDTAIWQR